MSASSPIGSTGSQTPIRTESPSEQPSDRAKPYFEQLRKAQEEAKKRSEEMLRLADRIDFNDENLLDALKGTTNNDEWVRKIQNYYGQPSN